MHLFSRGTEKGVRESKRRTSGRSEKEIDNFDQQTEEKGGNGCASKRAIRVTKTLIAGITQRVG